MWQDLRFGARMLAKQKLFTAAASLCLALGIGANTAIFSLAHAVLWRQLPVAHAEQLAFVMRGDGLNSGTFSYPDFQAIRERNEVLEDLAACAFVFGVNFGNGLRSEDLTGEMVSSNYFATLGVKPMMGRDFLPEENRVPDERAVVIVSEHFWRSRLDADPNVIGRQIRLNRHSFTIIGVAPATFTGINSPIRINLWIPAMMVRRIVLSLPFRLDDRRDERFRAVARFKPGVSLPQAQAALEFINQQLEQANPIDTNQPPTDRSIRLWKAQGILEEFIRLQARKSTALLWAVTSILLLLACANVANLLLARATTRRKEIAMRLALGASRWRLIRQLLTESMLLAALGAALGLVFAYWLNQLLMAFHPPFPESWGFAISLRLDGAAFGFTFLLVLVTIFLSGLAPAWQASKPDLLQSLKTDTASGAGRLRRFNLRSALVVTQIAISLLLLIGTGLFLRSLVYAQQLKMGYQAANRLTFTFYLAAQGYESTRQQQFVRQLLERLSALPGVQAATAASHFPLDVKGMRQPITIEGREAPSNAQPQEAFTQLVDEHYFKTLDTKILRGRAFTAQDVLDGAHVAIISNRLARHYWPNEEALGRRLRIGPPETPFREVVGIAEDTLQSLDRVEDFTAYRPFDAAAFPLTTFVVHSTLAPETIIPSLRREIIALEPNLPVQEIQPVEQVNSWAFWGARMGAVLLGGFGLLGLLLAIIGIYGVMSYAVTERTHEVGIRIALGAVPRDVLWLIVKQGLRLTFIGTAIGLALAFVATRLLASMLYGVSVRDPLAFMGAPLVLSVVALLACYVPARRATKVDPLIALRHE